MVGTLMYFGWPKVKMYHMPTQQKLVCVTTILANYTLLLSLSCFLYILILRKRGKLGVNSVRSLVEPSEVDQHIERQVDDQQDYGGIWIGQSATSVDHFDNNHSVIHLQEPNLSPEVSSLFVSISVSPSLLLPSSWSLNSGPANSLKIVFSQNPRDPRPRFGFGSVRVPRLKTEPEKSDSRVTSDSLNRGRISLFFRNNQNYLKKMRYLASVWFLFGPSSETENPTGKSKFRVTTDSSNQDQAES